MIFTIPSVEDTCEARRSGHEFQRVHDILNVYEVPRLTTVAEDSQRFPSERSMKKNRYDGTVIARRILAWSKDIEEAKCHYV